MATIAIDSTIPTTITLFASGACKVNAYTLQPDCDCMVQFFKADGTTAITGKIHIPQYHDITSAAQGQGVLISDSGMKLTISGTPIGSIQGYVTEHTD